MLALSPGPLWTILVAGKETEFRLAILSEWCDIPADHRLELGILAEQRGSDAEAKAA